MIMKGFQGMSQQNPHDHGEFAVWGVAGLPEVRPGDDLGELLVAAAADLRDGDIVVVTSKIVSKAEGRLLHGVDRDDVIDAETARVVSEWTTPRGRTRIVQTRHGFVLAAAGVDASNVEPGTVALLPEDPDGSARRLRAALRDRLGVEVGVVITDTAGRPWRDGLVDFAIGAAGVVARDDYRGRTDGYGNELGVTVVAVADELAAATELVRTKLSGVPVAVVRGLEHLVTAEDGPGAAVLIRNAEEDRFRLGSPEAMREAVFERRDVREFSGEPVDHGVVHRAIQAALTAPSPHGSAPWRFALVETAAARQRLSDVMLAAWTDDLRADGLDEAAIADRLAAGDVLRRAPYLIVPCLAAAGSNRYSDGRRDLAERRSYWLAMGAGIENLLVALAAEGLGSYWSHAPLFCMDVVARELALPDGWLPVAAVAVGHAASIPPEHESRDPGEYTSVR
jgi:coenzyme F420-0:L-glutamate ligase / coenzyme F420-1:gamma-L-glutamate ligase